MALQSSLRMQDPIYGLIDLTQVERAVVGCRTFQRLLSVKQLGLAYAAFPGADYSRFSHSIGACHVMSRMLESIRAKYDLDDTKCQIYRLAALLHDVGHYPFSHALEEAIERRYSPKTFESTGEAEGEETSDGSKLSPLDHEGVGEQILLLDNEIRNAIENSGLSVQMVVRVFKRADPDQLSNLISSDVDADRLDFLWRTAYHTGLPYGLIDQRYITREVRVDSEHRLCWNERALPALEHALISRYYDYSQVVHHKTVVAMELMLKSAVFHMTDADTSGGAHLDLSAEKIQEAIGNGTWNVLDDHQVFELIKKLQKVAENDGRPWLSQICGALVCRNPPKRVAEVGCLKRATFKATFRGVYDDLVAKIPEWADEFKIDRELWWVWKCERSFTKYASASLPAADDSEAAELPRVLQPDGSSIPTISHPQSVLGKLYAYQKYSLRVYVLLEDSKLRDSIATAVRDYLDRKWLEATSSELES